MEKFRSPKLTFWGWVRSWGVSRSAPEVPPLLFLAVGGFSRFTASASQPLPPPGHRRPKGSLRDGPSTEIHHDVDIFGCPAATRKPTLCTHVQHRRPHFTK
ncbi:unnamed protein product, partial [Nesidiocoris tenuis]